MKVSVIIPTKNEEVLLPNLLRLLSQQTRMPDEIIVADANSTDRTVSIAESFGARVVLGGLPSVGRNAGARVATGDILCFLDADVRLEQDMLEKALDEFENQSLEIATIRILPYDGSRLDAFVHAFYNAYVRLLKPFYAHANGACILVRRELHEQIQGFDERALFCEDHDYANRASKKGKFGILTSTAIYVTTRRMDRDGRFAIIAKSILAEFHLLFLGPIRHNFFRYSFGYEKDFYDRRKKKTLL